MKNTNYFEFSTFVCIPPEAEREKEHFQQPSLLKYIVNEYKI